MVAASGSQGHPSFPYTHESTPELSRLLPCACAWPQDTASAGVPDQDQEAVGDSVLISSLARAQAMAMICSLARDQAVARTASLGKADVRSQPTSGEEGQAEHDQVGSI
jgi:hypothetical protein